jgi:cation diffusion facilitator family transporter
LSERKELAEGGRISALSAILMTTIGIFELIVGLFTGSLGLVGDAVDSFADAATSFVVWIGLRISRRGPDAKFHFGYLKAETMYSMLGAIIIAGVGLVVMYESYTTLSIVRELKYGTSAIATALIAMTVSTVMLVYKIRKARSLGLLSMKTEVVNSATDSLSSITAFLGVTLADQLGIIQFDSIVGLVIGIFVLISSYNIIKESSLVLMDACSCHDVRDDLENVARSVPGVKEVRGVRLRKLGSYIVGDMVLVVDGRISVKDANSISKRVEEEAKKLFDDLYEIIVKFEPF